MLKINLGLKAFKPTKKSFITSSQLGYASFLTPNAKESFQKLKQVFCEENVLHHFDIFKPIRLETDESRKARSGVLYQQDIDMNWHPIFYYSPKILPAKRDYETYDAELLAIVEGFKT